MGFSQTRESGLHQIDRADSRAAFVSLREPDLARSALGPVEVHRAFSTAAAKWIMALKLESVLSDLMAIRLNSLSLQKKFSIRWRHLYISASIFNGWIRRGCWEITILAPRSSRSSMMTLLSKALSAMNASKLTPSRSGSMPMVS